jgi:hypothetical protein
MASHWPIPGGKMHTRNKRIVVHVTKTEHARIAKGAEQAGLSISAFMRRAAFAAQTKDGGPALSAMIDAVIEGTKRAEQAIDDTLEYVARSNERIGSMEAEARHQAEQP